MLSGDISKNGIIDLVKFLLAQNFEGELDLDCDGLRGQIQLRKGEILNASLGDFFGEQAFFTITRLDHAYFIFNTSENLQRNIKMETNKLIEEAERNIDPISILDPTTILVWGKIEGTGQISVDARKWMLAAKIGSGATIAQILKDANRPEEETKNLLLEMIKEGLVVEKVSLSKEKLYLFPKPVSVDLTPKESQVYKVITGGSQIHEVYDKTTLSVWDFADIINVLTIKRLLTVADQSGKIVPNWYVRKALGLASETVPISLLVKLDQSFIARVGVTTISEIQVDLWESQLFGAKVEGVLVDGNNSKTTFNLAKSKIAQDVILITPSDFKLYGYSDGAKVQCTPLTKGV